MKFSEMTEKQQDAFKTLLITALTVRTQEEQQYTQQFLRLLMLGNGTGIAILATFMGALAKNNQQLLLLRKPLVTFLIGAFIAALIYIPLTQVANEATNNITAQVQDFFLDKKEIEDIQGYGFNRLGKFVVALLQLASLILFVLGVVQCIRVLGHL